MKNPFSFIWPGGQGRLPLATLLATLLLVLAGTGSAWAQAQAIESAPTWQAAIALNQLPSDASDVRGTATDAAGNVYITGNFSGQVTFGSTVLTSAGSSDVFVARYNSATSTWAWASSGGGGSIDSGNGIATDGTNVYITGQFFGGASFAGQALTNAGSYDVFVAAYNATTGAGAWATRGGNAGTENSFGIATDGTRVYVTGYFNGSTTSIAGQTLTSAGGADVFVAAYTATTGAGAWATRGGGTSPDQGAGIATDGTRVYVTGNFGSSASIAGQTLTSAGTFTNDVFVAAYTATTGAGAWATRGGGTSDDSGTGIAVSGTSVYVTGYFASGTSASFAGQGLTGAGNNDAFVAAYTTTGTGAWARSGGGSGSDIGFDLATSGTSVHVTGYFASGTSASFAGQALAGTGTNNNDVFVATYDGSSGVGAGASSGGGSGSDNGYSIAATSTRVYVGGSAALPATFGPVTLAGTSPQVGILSVLAPAGSPTLTSLSPTSGPTGTAITLTGINLTGITGVRFNGTAATVFSTGTGTSATATVPVGATTGTVTVTTAIGTSNGISFTVGPPLAVSSLTPARNAFAASRSANVGITFNYALDATTAGNVRVFSSERGGQLVRGGNATASGSILTVDPATDFKAGETVLVTVPTTVKSSGGTAATKQVYQFTAAVGLASTGRFGNGNMTAVGPSDSPMLVRLVDVNSDGTLDLLTVLDAGSVSVRLGTGNGAYSSSSTSVVVGSNPLGIDLGDFDNDGDLDFATVSYANNSLSVRLNDGTGTFLGTTDVALGSAGRNVLAGDVDGDGDLDLVVGTGSGFKLLLNSGTGSFAAPTGLGGTSGTIYNTGALGDVDNDGDLDLAYGSYTASGQVLLLLNNGAGSYTAGTPVTVGTYPRRVVLADLNNDGKLDLMSTNYFTSTGLISVRQGDGAGGFSGSTELPAGSNPKDVAAVDVDGDGDLDVLGLGSLQPSIVYTYLNDGTGTLTAGTNSQINTLGVEDVAFGDVDNDGDVDLAAANVSSIHSVSIRLNQQVPSLTSLAPTSGPVGTTITLTGTDLTGATTITFTGISGNTVASGYTVNSAGTQITGVVVPSGATTGNVTVTTLFGTTGGVAFTVTALANVTTAAATSITTTSATLGGNVTADGGATITERGVVFVAGFGTPTTASTKLTASGTTGSYTASATGLTAATLYTVRAYAINSAGTSYGSSQTFTTTPNAPGVVVPANNSLVSTTTPNYAGTGTASSTVTVYVDGTSIGTTTASPTAGNWSLNQPTALSQGSHTVQATASISGSAASGFSNTNNFTVDTVPPSVTLGSTAGASGSGTSTSPLPFTATFSENVTGFVVGGITVSNGTLSGFSGSATTYTFNVTPTGAGAVTVSVPANGAQDAAGNGNTAAASYTLTYAPAPAAFTVSTGTLAAPTSIPAGTYTSITVTGTGNAILSGAVSVSTGLTVQSGGSLSTNCQTLNGAGSFTLATSATLYVCDDAGITTSGATGAVQVTGTRSFATDASYVYNGNGAVQSTGNGLPAQVRNLTAANNNNDVRLSQAVRVVQVLTVSGKGDLVLNGQALTLLSDATGTALAVNSNSGVVNGTATVQRYIDGSLNAGAGYRHLSAPVTNTTVADLATVMFAPEVSQASTYNTSTTPGTTTPFPTVFSYDQARLVTASNSNYAAFDKGFFVPAGLSTALTPGQGYAVNIAAGQLVDFVGTLGTGDRTLSLARNSGPTAADDGWQLVGNPYPAPLDFSLVAPADRAGLDASMYVFESSSQYAGAYRAYVNGVGGSSLVGNSQAFFVRVSSGNTAGTLTFRNAQRLTSYATQVPVRRGANDLRPQLHLTLAGATGPADAVVLYTEAGATAGTDPQFDAVKLANPSGLNLATGLASGQQLAIDGRPVLTAAMAVPLVVGVPAMGTYTFAVAELRNFAPGTRLELVDNLTGTRTPLATGTTYACTLAGFTAPGRFWLALAPAGALATGTQALAAQVQLYPNPAHGTCTLVRPVGSGPASATLLNALGQVVRTLSLPTAETRVDLTGLATGVYTLRLPLGGQPITKRLVIE